MATLVGLAASSVFLNSAMSSAASMGLTLQREQVLQSCIDVTRDSCGYLVFIHYQARAYQAGNEVEDGSPLTKVLPPQLAHMPFRSSRNGLQSTCSVEQLGEFVQRILRESHQALSKGVFVFETPVDVASCFQTTATSFDDISFIVRDGTINGFVSCRPDTFGVALCDVNFARSVGGREERLSMSSFRKDEITELFSNFPHFPDNGGSQNEGNFAEALNWAQELFSDSVTGVKLGE